MNLISDSFHKVSASFRNCSVSFDCEPFINIVYPKMSREPLINQHFQLLRQVAVAATRLRAICWWQPKLPKTHPSTQLLVINQNHFLKNILNQVGLICNEKTSATNSINLLKVLICTPKSNNREGKNCERDSNNCTTIQSNLIIQLYLIILYNLQQG